MINRKLSLIQFYNDTKETNHFDQISRTIQRNLYYYFKHSSNKPQRYVKRKSIQRFSLSISRDFEQQTVRNSSRRITKPAEEIANLSHTFP